MEDHGLAEHEAGWTRKLPMVRAAEHNSNGALVRTVHEVISTILPFLPIRIISAGVFSKPILIGSKSKIRVLPLSHLAPGTKRAFAL